MTEKCSELENMTNSLDYFYSIKAASDDLIKFFKSYRQLNQDYIKKLQSFYSGYKKKYSTPDNSKISHIIKTLTSKLTNLIDQNIELNKLSIDEIDTAIKEFEAFIKSKTDSIKSLQKSSLELGKSLMNAYNEMNKAKNNYLNTLAKTEDIISKYYSDKLSIKEHESGIGHKLNENEYTTLKEQQKYQKLDVDNFIKFSKKNESIYKNSIISCQNLQDNYIKSHNSFTEEIKKDSCDLSEEMKKHLITFMLSIKNSNRQPLNYIDSTVNYFNTLEEGKEIDTLINSQFKNNNPLKIISPTNYKLKSLSIIKEANNEDYNNKKDNKKEVLKRRRSISKLQDGFNSMQYVSDASLVNTIKDIFDNFTYIDKEDFNLAKEENKSRTQKYILKIETNMYAYPFSKYGIKNAKRENPNIDVNVKYKREELTPEEVTDLKTLLDDHENRIVFMQKLSDYRTLGRYYLCQQDYDLLTVFFNIILDKIKRDLDYHSAEMIIILSQTYCIEDGDKKKYIQQSIKNNALLKDKHFWEEFLCFSINKEIMKTLDRDEKRKESKQHSDVKLSNLVFSQLLTLIDNMYEFDLDSKDIQEILGPKMTYYKIKDDLKNTINEVINSKEAERAERAIPKNEEEKNIKKNEDIEKKEDENKNEKKESEKKNEDKVENVIKNEKEKNEEDKNENKEKGKDDEKLEKEGNKNEIINNGENKEEEKKKEEENKINNEGSK